LTAAPPGEDGGMRVWLVRAGRAGEQEGFALANGCAVIGWSRMEDLAVVESREEMVEEVRIKDPHASERRLANHAAQLWAFARRIEPGDLAVLPSKVRRTVAVGRVTGPYRYEPANPSGARHVRPVDWVRPDVPRDAIGQDLLWSLGASMTICQVSRNGAAERFAAILATGVDPGPPAG
jgi:restriction system protein